MKKNRVIILVASVVFIVVLLTLKLSPSAAAFLQNAGSAGSWFLPLVVFSAMIDSVNPCAFSVLLLTIAFLGSMSASRAKILQVGASYVAGIFLVYLLIGLGLLKALQFFGMPNFLAKFGAAVVIIFGLINIIGHYFPNFPIKFKIPTASHGKIALLISKASVLAAFILGAMVAIFEFPCTGGPYLVVLTLLNDNSTYFAGVGYLLLYNVVFVLPLAIILILSGSFGLSEWVQKLKADHTGDMKLFGGGAMILLGLLILLLS